MEGDNSEKNDVEMKTDSAQEGNRVVMYDGHTRIMTADGRSIRVLDQKMREHMAANRSLGRDEETRQTKLAAAKTARSQRIRVPNPNGEGEVEVEADFDNPEHVRLIKEQNSVRVQNLIPANDETAHPSRGIIRNEMDWRESQMFIEYKGRFPPDRASFTMEFTMPVVKDGESFAPAGVIKIAGFMQQFPVFLVRTPLWACELLLHGVPIHIVSVKLLGLAALYLTTLCRGYGAPNESETEFFNQQGEPRAPFKANADATIASMKKLVECMRNFEATGVWKPNEGDPTTREILFSNVASRMVWMMWNRPDMLEEAIRRESTETRPTPRWFMDAWRRNTGKEAVSVLPITFTDEMLQAPLVNIVVLNFNKKRLQIDNAVYEALERGDYGAPFCACSEVLRLYDDTIWEVLSACRNPDYLQAHREYTPFNFYRRAKGLEPDHDLAPVNESNGAVIDTRFIINDDGDWVHPEAAAECARYAGLMDSMTIGYENDLSMNSSNESSYYRPSDRSLIRHALMVASENDTIEKTVEIEAHLIQNLPQVMRELIARNQNPEFEKYAVGNVMRVDVDPSREPELMMRPVATKYDGKCAECKKNMPVEYDDELQLTFFTNATTRKDGKVACFGCISLN